MTPLSLGQLEQILAFIEKLENRSYTVQDLACWDDEPGEFNFDSIVLVRVFAIFQDAGIASARSVLHAIALLVGADVRKTSDGPAHFLFHRMRTAIRQELQRQIREAQVPSQARTD